MRKRSQAGKGAEAAGVGGAAGRAFDGVVRAGAAHYDRKRHLPALVRVEPAAAGADEISETRRIVALLERALRAERNRARSGHWTYDLNRHIALHQALRAEEQRLSTLSERPD
ncbi:DUF6477 family protein [Faunimonas sp. B44]|uniref:DUF6477 family protein n=1 Tax=Faunimonas sp. B44 TaxID=3461493 RepID=UPI004044B669